MKDSLQKQIAKSGLSEIEQNAFLSFILSLPEDTQSAIFELFEVKPNMVLVFHSNIIAKYMAQLQNNQQGLADVIEHEIKQLDLMLATE